MAADSSRGLLAVGILLLLSQVGEALSVHGDWHDAGWPWLLWAPTQALNFYHLHIPKVAGTSFREDAKLHLPHGADLLSTEGCYGMGPAKGRKTIVLFREPRDHVLSQYTHCASAPVHQSKNQDLGHDPLPDTFDKWVQAWRVELRLNKTTRAFSCYMPWDLQVHRMACNSENPGAIKSRSWLKIDVQKAIKNMEEAEFVGLKEYYKESLCLLHAKFLKTLPKSCDCTDPSFNGTAISYQAHGVSEHSIMDYPKETRSAVDVVTKKDRLLYDFAARRFFKELGDAEKAYKMKINCKPLPDFMSQV